MLPAYVKSGTDVAYAATSCLRARYAMSGTDLGYAAPRYRMRRARVVRSRVMYWQSIGILLRAPYAMSDANISYAATRALRDVRY
eukprot:3295132-Rhodomonas_salina.5